MTHTAARDHAHEDVYVAIRDAVNAAPRDPIEEALERGCPLPNPSLDHR